MSTDIGIDLGTSKTILLSGSKVILEQPSVVTVDTETWEPIAYGEKAYAMVGRTPDSLTTVYPIERGVIADYNIAEQMLKFYMRKAFGNRIVKPRVMVSMPIGVTSIQHRSVAKAVEIAGGRNVCTVEGPVAAAIGLGVDFNIARGSMIIDIGAGTTDVATISMGGLAECTTARMASFDFDEAIIKYIKKVHNILIGKQTAENIKIQIGSVVPRQVEIAMQAKGRNIFTGLPEIFEITATDIFEAVKDTADTICLSIKSVIENTSPDLISDIMTDGIHLTGGGASIYGMEELLSEYLGVSVKLSQDPIHSVARGAGMALKNPQLLKNGDYQFRSIQELIVE
ncbi:MAG: rod shape-determining protein [Oscillospiraceae bacterium]|nr:rod shape-determining protein [Oscillospiraceae bacterium]